MLYSCSLKSFMICGRGGCVFLLHGAAGQPPALRLAPEALQDFGPRKTPSERSARSILLHIYSCIGLPCQREGHSGV